MFAAADAGTSGARSPTPAFARRFGAQAVVGLGPTYPHPLQHVLSLRNSSGHFRKPDICCAGRRRYADRPIWAVAKVARSLNNGRHRASNAVRDSPVRSYAASHAGRTGIGRSAY